jgi:hypothetical protein
MSFYAKLAIFWVGLYLAIYLLARFPNSRISRLAFSWHGPVPSPGERKSHLMFRWAGYALSWLAQITFVFALGYVATWWRPSLADEMWFLALWAFALPIFGGMAFLGALMALLTGLKAQFLGPNPTLEFIQGGNQA